jgi:hypothetical protein
MSTRFAYSGGKERPNCRPRSTSLPRPAPTRQVRKGMSPPDHKHGIAVSSSLSPPHRERRWRVYWELTSKGPCRCKEIATDIFQSCGLIRMLEPAWVRMAARCIRANLDGVGTGDTTVRPGAAPHFEATEKPVGREREAYTCGWFAGAIPIDSQNVPPQWAGKFGDCEGGPM